MFVCALKAVLKGLVILCLLSQAQDFEDPEVHHRHLSHLFGLFPGHTINLEMPDLCKAAESSLYKRGLYVLIDYHS